VKTSDLVVAVSGNRHLASAPGHIRGRFTSLRSVPRSEKIPKA
jgi:hypothetical protein